MIASTRPRPPISPIDVTVTRRGRRVHRAKNKTKSSVRAKVEHPFLIIKRIFGSVKTRYKGLEKNAHRLFITCALANLYMLRRQLWRLAGA